MPVIAAGVLFLLTGSVGGGVTPTIPEERFRPSRSSTGEPSQDDVQRLEQLNQRVASLYRARRYADALPVAEEALQLSMTAREATKEDVLSAMANVAQLYRQVKRDTDAEKMYRSALAFAGESSLADSAMAGVVHDNLARLLLTSGRLEEADRESAEALRVLRSALNPRHPTVAGALNNRAILLLERGEFDEAERHCLEALEILEEAFGKDNPQLAPFHEDLAEIRRRKAEAAAGTPAPPPDGRER
jgi:tetratricopeptide (TPR) repeat protein